MLGGPCIRLRGWPHVLQLLSMHRSLRDAVGTVTEVVSRDVRGGKGMPLVVAGKFSSLVVAAYPPVVLPFRANFTHPDMKP